MLEFVVRGRFKNRVFLIEKAAIFLYPSFVYFLISIYYLFSLPPPFSSIEILKQSVQDKSRLEQLFIRIFRSSFQLNDKYQPFDVWEWLLMSVKR